MHEHTHQNHTESSPKEYLKFGLVLISITVISYFVYRSWPNLNFPNAFMGVFFLTFAAFKLLDLPGFVMSYIGYDILAKKFTWYAYLYPFLEILLGLGYLFQVPHVNFATVILMFIGTLGVGRELLKGSKIKCACLGTYIKLPLTTVSLVEDLGMGLMALVSIL